MKNENTRSEDCTNCAKSINKVAKPVPGAIEQVVMQIMHWSLISETLGISPVKLACADLGMLDKDDCENERSLFWYIADGIRRELLIVDSQDVQGGDSA